MRPTATKEKPEVSFERWFEQGLQNPFCAGVHHHDGFIYKSNGYLITRRPGAATLATCAKEDCGVRKTYLRMPWDWVGKGKRIRGGSLIEGLAAILGSSFQDAPSPMVRIRLGSSNPRIALLDVDGVRETPLFKINMVDAWQGSEVSGTFNPEALRGIITEADMIQISPLIYRLEEEGGKEDSAIYGWGIETPHNQAIILPATPRE